MVVVLAAFDGIVFVVIDFVAVRALPAFNGAALLSALIKRIAGRVVFGQIAQRRGGQSDQARKIQG